MTPFIDTTFISRFINIFKCSVQASSPIEKRCYTAINPKPLNVATVNWILLPYSYDPIFVVCVWRLDGSRTNSVLICSGHWHLWTSLSWQSAARIVEAEPPWLTIAALLTVWGSPSITDLLQNAVSAAIALAQSPFWIVGTKTENLKLVNLIRSVNLFIKLEFFSEGHRGKLNSSIICPWSE